MSTPIAGVRYWYNSGAGLWEAPGRPSLSAELTASSTFAGAVPIGEASYPYPQNAVFLATTAKGGSPSGSGSILSPKSMLAAAIAAVPQDGTIVVRGCPVGVAWDAALGEFRENAGQTTKRFTLQNYPGEEVWFDGTDVVTGWTSSGGQWWAPLTVEFSHIAGHSQGSPDDPTRWTDTQNPIAHYTDQVFIDGVRQWQVASTPGAGQFSVDYGTNRVWIGTNPAGKEVRVATRTKLLHVSAQCTIRGIGWRRYATEMWELGTVYVATAGGGTVIENCHMVDVATQPLAVLGSGSRVSDCTIIRPGQTGIHVNRSDNSVFERIVVDEHNWEKFRTQPHCGGIKVTFSGNTTIRDCWFNGASNRAESIWFDASNWGGVVANNYAFGGYGGIFLEATGKFIVAGNRCQGNAGTYHGLLLTISKQIRVWNNYADRTNGYTYANWQDDRNGAYERFQAEAGRWWSVDNEFVNNVAGGSHNLFMFYNRLDAASQGLYPYERMVTRFEGNTFSSTAGQNPPVSASRLAGFVDGSTQTDYTRIETFQAARPWAVGNRLTSIQAPTDAEMAALPGAVPLPADVAAAMGVTAGSTRVGPPRPAPVPREA